MRESLICIGKIGEKGYYFEDTGIQIFSYEELCYYMSQHMICYIHTLPGEDLLAYIRDELDLDKLSKQLSKLLDPEKDQMKYFAALFREGHYFNEDEIRDILDEYRGLMNAPVYLQKKWMGDLLTSSGRASRAIRSRAARNPQRSKPARPSRFPCSSTMAISCVSIRAMAAMLLASNLCFDNENTFDCEARKAPRVV